MSQTTDADDAEGDELVHMKTFVKTGIQAAK